LFFLILLKKQKSEKKNDYILLDSVGESKNKKIRCCHFDVFGFLKEKKVTTKKNTKARRSVLSRSHKKINKIQKYNKNTKKRE